MKIILASMFLLLPAAAFGQATRLNPEEVSARIRERLASRGVSLSDVAREARTAARPQMRRRGAGMRPKMEGDGGPSERDQQTIDRIVRVFDNIYGVYEQLQALDWRPDLYIGTDPVINAYAGYGSEVHIYMAVSELVGDSDSELAFVIAHELGHIVQQRVDGLWFVPDNAEFDADVWGALVCLAAGFDPYAGSGTLSKLAMATGDVGLQQQFEDQSAADAHKSFVTRVEVQYDALKAVCNVNADFQQKCAEYRSAMHPHFPANAVL